MKTIVRRNERSWAIDLIYKINEIVRDKDLLIKRAGGENTISTAKANSMFPDVVLYGDREQNLILQGWELKMPDVPIENEVFIQDAQRKARALGLTSCVIWNFTYAALYIVNDRNEFEPVKQWDDTSHIRTRDDVKKYRDDWEKLLEEIIISVNDYLLYGKFRESLLSKAISSATVVELLRRNQQIVADKLAEISLTDSTIEAYIDNWWREVKAEYEKDERDMYSAYAKSIILNWFNRITFAHILKSKQNVAKKINEMNKDWSPKKLNNIFEQITNKCDFYNIFEPVAYSEMVAGATWNDLVDYSLFLRDNGLEHISQSALQDILECSVARTKRELSGQYTTPYELAKILACITIHNWQGNVWDCCCGTGTIPRAVIAEKSKRINLAKAMETVWASDKYQFPLQVANISMTSANAMRMASRLFKKDVLFANIRDDIQIINPADGKIITYNLPRMDAIVSNLPFVRFESLNIDDINDESAKDTIKKLDKRSDLYCYIAAKTAGMLTADGYLGIITSNSWLGTEAGDKFIKVMRDVLSLEQVHISGKGRWFQNADVVATLLLFKNCLPEKNKKVSFFLWNKKLDELAENEDWEKKLINSSLLNRQVDREVTSICSYTWEEIEELKSLHVSYNVFFHGANWLKSFKNIVIPINEVFYVNRGSRRGWDKLFYPKDGEHEIEEEYLEKVLMNARSVEKLDTEPDSYAFCCNKSLKELKSLKHHGAIRWINKFKKQTNGKGKPLVDVLRKKDCFWYEMQRNELAELFTMMNPDTRFFVGRFPNGTAFINQRLIGLSRKKGYEDIELYHALLNSVITLFSIEAVGFGRGLGVLDINKKSISHCMMFNPMLISDSERSEILKRFNFIKKRKILTLLDELKQADRLDFEKCVFRAYGVERDLQNVINTLQSMQKTRIAAKH